MSANEEIFLDELAIFLRLRLAKFSKSPKAIAQFISPLIFVPAEGVSIQDAIQSSSEICSQVHESLQEEGVYVSFDGLSLDSSLQPIFQLFVQIEDDELELELTYVVKVSQTTFEAEKIDFEFNVANSKNVVWEKLVTRIKGCQIFGALKKSK